MHNFTIVELAETLLASVVFLALMAPPGFAVGWALNIRNFRRQSATEQLLWTFALSLPFNLVLANLPARYLPASLTLGLFLAADLAAIILRLVLRRRGAVPRLVLDHRARLVLACLAGGVVYLCLAGMPLQIGHRLFEPVFSSDWEIRLPLLQAAVRDGVPPHNPFFTFQGISPPSRYYYYWFSLCAQVIRLAHTDARGTLIASAVYSGLCLVAVLFLCLKYLQRPDGRLRQRCLLLLSLFLVLGLDILPNLLGLHFWKMHIQPEIEWWLPDRSPGPLAALLYAPHHVAGATCGFLLVLLLGSLLPPRDDQPGPPLLATGIAVTLVFAAMAGTSTFVTMFFGLFAAVLAILCLVRRNPRVALVVAGAGLVSLAVSVPYLHELLAKTVAAPPTAASPHTHLLSFELRQYKFALWLIDRIALVRHVAPPLHWRARFLRLLLTPFLFLVELGFYLVAIAVQLRQDFFAGQRSSAPARLLWLLAGCVGVFYLCITSSGVQAVNDLGVHAGLILRLITMLWGAQVLAWYLAQRRRNLRWTHWQTAVIRLAAACLLLGLGTTLWQIAVERTYLVLVDHHTIPAAPPFAHSRQMARVYFDVHQAQAATARSLPAAAVIQSNPTGQYQLIFRLYQQRRQAAGDISCEGTFGGDPATCRGFIVDILKLFGTHPPIWSDLPHHLHSTPADRTVAALDAVCRQVGLAAVLASSADPVWYDPQSWVWQGSLLFANPNVRVVRCPAS